MHFLRKRHALDEELVDSPHLVVSNTRLKNERNFLRRCAPVLYSKYRCNFDGMLHDTRRRSYMDAFFSQSKPPLFTNVQIETLNRCNGECSFCPVNRHVDPRISARMSEELFESFVSQLSALNYDKTFGFFSNNEPLLDKRLPVFIQEAKKRLPKAAVTTVTNGTLLTTDLFRQIMPYLSTIIINDYNKEPGLHPNIKEVRNYCLSPEGQKLIAGKRVVIEMRNPESVLGSRGGGSPNREPVLRPLRALCLCFFRQFIIRPDGRISQCCNDALGKVTMGNLNEASAEEIWQGQFFAEARRIMAEKGRAGLPLCADCDFTGWIGK